MHHASYVLCARLLSEEIEISSRLIACCLASLSPGNNYLRYAVGTALDLSRLCCLPKVS